MINMDVLDSIKTNNSTYSIGQDITSLSLNGVIYKLGKDRNTVGKNNAIGLNTSHPSIAFTTVESIENTLPIGESNTHICMRVPDGYYNGSSYIGALNSKMANLIPANIKWGISIAGVTGTAETYVQTYGTIKSSSSKLNFIDNRGISRSYYYINVALTEASGSIVPTMLNIHNLAKDRIECFTDFWGGYLLDFSLSNTIYTFNLKTNGNFKWSETVVQFPVCEGNTNYQYCICGKWHRK